MSGNFWKGYKVLYKIIQEGERVGLKPKSFLQFLMESHEKKKKIWPLTSRPVETLIMKPSMINGQKDLTC